MSEKELKGKQFEEYVRTLYEALGYTVVPDNYIGGQQIDLVASKVHAGIGLTKLLVECKYKSNRSISNQEMFDFINMYNSVKNIGQFTNAIFVTNSSFSRHARLAANNASIHIRTTNELENEMFNLNDAYWAYIKDYEALHIHQHYENIRAEGLLPHSFDNFEIESNRIEERLIKWINSGTGGYLPILGDFGAGKTTLLLKLKHILCKQNVENKNKLIPVYFKLRNFGDCNSIEEYITKELSSQFQKTIPLQVFWQFIKDGKIVILLDGFDEISSRAGTSYRNQAFQSLTPLILHSGATILTCRPSFFVSTSEYNSYISKLIRNSYLPAHKYNSVRENEFQIQQQMAQIQEKLTQKYIHNIETTPINDEAVGKVNILCFDEKQIKCFLQKFNDDFVQVVGHEWGSIYSYLEQVYDLSDLMKRPFLLQMIVDTILTGNLDINDQERCVGVATLYEIYISCKLSIESSSTKNRVLLTKEQRIKFAESLALTMLINGYKGIKYKTIIQTIHKTGILQELQNKLIEVTEDEIATDLRVCAFLRREDTDEFVFSHKSFMEFFVAKFMIDSHFQNYCLNLLGLALPSEVLYFLGSFCELNSQLQEQLEELYKRSPSASENPYFRGNIIGIFFNFSTVVTSVYFQNARLEQLFFNHINWKFSQLTKTQLSKLTCRSITLEQCNWSGIKINSSLTKHLSLIESQFNANLNDTEISEFDVKDNSIIKLSGKLHIPKTIIKRSTVVLDGVFSFERINIEHSKVTLAGDDKSNYRLGDSYFKNSKIICNSNVFSDAIFLTDSIFEDCSFFGLPCREEILFDNIHEQKELKATVFKNCKGVIFIPNKTENSKVGPFKWFNKVCIIDIYYLLPVRKFRKALKQSPSYSSLIESLNNKFPDESEFVSELLNVVDKAIQKREKFTKMA